MTTTYVNIYLFPIIFVHLGNNIMVMLVFGNKLLLLLCRLLYVDKIY
jgi:hypothetical protein